MPRRPPAGTRPVVLQPHGDSPIRLRPARQVTTIDNYALMRAQQHHMSVCPHDTAKNLYGWFLLNSHLQKHLGIRMHFEPQGQVLTERQAVVDGDFQFVYANPYSAAVFASARGFIPVAAPIGVRDEAVLISRPGWDRRQAVLPVKVASATDKLVIHPLGVTLLPRVGLDESLVRYSFTGNHLLAAKAVLTGDADLAFIFNETWATLADRTRSELVELAVTEQRLAFHCFMVGGDLVGRSAEIGALLCGLADDPAGQDILHELGLPRGLEPVTSDRLDTVSRLIAA